MKIQIKANFIQNPWKKVKKSLKIFFTEAKSWKKDKKFLRSKN